MNAILYFLLVVLCFVIINIEIDSNNPCSSFSEHPSECSSDTVNQ